MTIQTQNLQNRLNTPAAQGNRPATLAVLLQREDIKKRFADVLGGKAAGFMTSILSTTNGNTKLAQCEPNSVIGAAMVAAALDLPIDPNLGFAHMVPYGGKAQFQMGWRGYVQLAMRSAQYKTISVAEVYEGEITRYDRITGNVERGEQTAERIIGYCAYFQLLNGYERYLFMTQAEVEAHGKRYSKTYSFRDGVWQTNFDAMARKTVLKKLLKDYGILSIQMMFANKADQAVIRDVGGDVMDAQVEYVDGGTDEGEVIDVWAEAEKQAQEAEAITK